MLITTVPAPASIELTEVPKHDGKLPLPSQHLDNDADSGDELVPARRRSTFFVMTALLLALFLSTLSFTVVTTAIPTITAHFHSASAYTWIGSALQLANTAVAPIWGKLSNIWGRKPIILTATTIFAVASVICARASSITMLIAGRALQGVGGCGLMLLVNICISDLFSVRKRGMYYGMTEIIWAITGGGGPLLGGAFSQYASWRWIWYINLPITAAVFILIFFFLDVHNPRTPVLEGLKAIDWSGSISILGFTLMFLLGLEFGGIIFPWNSPAVICLIVFGVVMLGIFILTQTKLVKSPIMPLHILKKRTNVAVFTICFTHGMCFIGIEYYLPLYFQSVLQLTPLRSGLLILPISIVEALAGAACGFLIHRFGHYLWMIYIGAALQTLGIGLFIHLGSSSSIAQIVVFQLILGVGAGVLFTPPLIALQSSIRQADTALATSAFSFVRNLSMSISIVVGGVVFQNSMGLRASSLEAAGISGAHLQQLSSNQAAANVYVIGVLEGAQRQAAKDAYAWSLRNLWIMYCAVSSLSIIASIFIARQELETKHSETKTGLHNVGEEK